MHFPKIQFYIIGFVLTGIAGTVWGQSRNTETATIQYESALYSGLQWRLVGPFRGGRAGTVSGVAHDPFLYYMGTAGGGVWKTQDGGQTWGCISDGFFGGSIGALAVAPSDPNIIYVGEGEQTVRGDVSSGKGMWRSDDGGKSWAFIGLEASEHIGRIRVHPKDPDRVYVAVMGNLWKPGVVRGIYRSENGGNTWEKVLFVDEMSGAVDLVLDPANPRVIYAGTWQIRRNGYRMDSGGPGSKLWKSTNGGDTWVDLSDRPGLPDAVWGIVGVTVSPAMPERVWAIIEAKDGGLFRSDDAGETWQLVSARRSIRQRAWYYSRVYADPMHPDWVYVLNVALHLSKDGGKTFDIISTPHGDHHDLWIDPNNPDRLAVADDGGAQVSFNGGQSWTTYHNQPTAQFYRVTTDNHFPFRILGAQQDNSTVRILHRSHRASITERDWERTAGGESAHLAPDPGDPDIVYGGTYKGYMMRYDHRTGQMRSTNVWPDNPAGSGAEVMKYRFNWNFPIFFSPHDPDRLYACSNHLHVSQNEGQSWEVISPDLTRNDPNTIRSSGGPITQDNTGVEYYATIMAAAESHHEQGVLWTGSDDGLIHVSKDGGQQWVDVTPPMAPDNLMINCIEIHPFEQGGVYVAATRYKFGDYTPYLYKTTDYGQNWEIITAGIDPTHYTRTIRADPGRPGLLYAGTEWGMYLSFDDGRSWQSFQLNLPVVSIRDLHVRDDMLIAATHGRSFWMIDDLTPLHQLSEDIEKMPFYLFQPKPAYRMAQSSRTRGVDLKLQGQNHANGVLFQYYLGNVGEKDTIQLTIFEDDGKKIKSFSNQSGNNTEKLKAEKGGHQFVWDMRYPGFETFPGMVLYASPNAGPRAVPGTYIAELQVGDKTSRQEFKILKDPRLDNTPGDYQKQFDFLIQVRDKVTEAHRTILEIRALRRDLDYFQDKVRTDHPQLHKEVMDLKMQLDAIENRIHQTKNKSRQDPLNYGIRLNNRLAFLMADQQRGDFPPTDQAEEVRLQLFEQLDGVLRDYQLILENPIPEINRKMREAGIRLIGEGLGKNRS